MRKIKRLSFLIVAIAIVIIIFPKIILAAGCAWGNFEVGVPGLSSNDICTLANSNTAIIDFAGAIVNVIIAAIVVIGLISIVIGGYVYMTAGGSASRVGLAKTIIISALSGIALALAVFLILTLISPQFKPTQDPSIILHCAPNAEQVCPCVDNKPCLCRNPDPTTRKCSSSDCPSTGICPSLR